MPEMKYGASDHYQTQKGREYFAYQQSFRQGAVLEARKFQPFVKSGDKVLDFGCGGGWVLANLQCAKRVGVELNPAARELCLGNGVAVYSHIDEVPDRGFDVIISNHCLEHVPCPSEALRALRSLLDDNGKLVVVVPVDDWRVQKDFTGQDIDHHLHTWTPRLMANTLAEGGFHAESIRMFTYAWFPGWRRAMAILPVKVFDLFCWAMAVVKKRRQLVVLACKKP